MLELPIPILLPLSQLWERLFDYYNFRSIVGDFLVLINITLVHLLQIICQNSVIEVENLTQVCIHDEGSIIHSKIFFSGNLDLYLSEPLPDGRPA